VAIPCVVRAAVDRDRGRFGAAEDGEQKLARETAQVLRFGSDPCVLARESEGLVEDRREWSIPSEEARTERGVGAELREHGIDLTTESGERRLVRQLEAL